jgi:hypothetical protein
MENVLASTRAENKTRLRRTWAEFLGLIGVSALTMTVNPEEA